MVRISSTIAAERVASASSWQSKATTSATAPVPPSLCATHSSESRSITIAVADVAKLVERNIEFFGECRQGRYFVFGSRCYPVETEPLSDMRDGRRFFTGDQGDCQTGTLGLRYRVEILKAEALSFGR